MNGQDFAFQPFSIEEIENLKSGLLKLESDLKQNPENWDAFIDDPIAFFDRFNISVLRRFRANPEAVKRFNKTIKNTFKKLGNIFNRCLACKTAVIIMFYSLMGSTAQMFDITIVLFKTLLDGVEKYFGGTSNDSNSLLKKIGSLVNQLTISELALNICKYYGQCPVAAEIKP